MKAEQAVRAILSWPSWGLMFACLSIVLTAALWYNTTPHTKLFQWYEDLALYKQGALVAMTTMLMVVIMIALEGFTEFRMFDVDVGSHVSDDGHDREEV